MLKKISKFIVDKRYILFGLFFIFLIFSLVFMSHTNVNYDLSKYLSEDTETRQALKIMEDEFSATSSVNLMIKKTDTVDENNLNELVTKLNNMDGVTLASLAKSNDNYQMISIMLNTGDYDKASQETVLKIEELLKDYTFYVSGASVNSMTLENNIEKEVKIILLVAVLIILAVLLLTSHSWFEPVIFLIVIGVSILINMGTNFIFGSISYITQSVQAILQLALAMDYSIILLHAYEENLTKGYDDKKAIIHALWHSLVSIFSSALTTIAGLSALMFMSFTIGFDIGMVLSKGILCSMLTVFLLMPGLILLFRKPLLKLKHKPLSLKGNWIHKVVDVAKIPISVVLIILIGVCFVLQQHNDYIFAYETNSPQSEKIKKEFGSSSQMVIILPLAKTSEDYQKQIELEERLKTIQIDNQTIVSGVTSMSNVQDGMLVQPMPIDNLVSMTGLEVDTITMIYDFFKLDHETELTYNVVLTIDDFLLKAENEALTAYDMANTLHYDNFLMAYVYIKLNVEKITIKDFVNKIQTIDEFEQLEEPKKNLIIQMDALFQNQTMINSIHEIASQVRTGVSNFNSDKHSRMVINLDITASQKEKNKKTIELIKKEVSNIYNGENHYLAGQNMVSYDIEKAFKSDLLKVNLITIIAILIILLISLKSLLLPIILVFVIQGAIYISMSTSYIFNQPIFFMSYLICICIQMGATIDYGIILTSKYLYSRKEKDKNESMKDAIRSALPTILTSGTILVVAGFIVYFISSEMAISSIGLLLGRGTIISIILVLFLLPSLILLLDKPILKLMLHKKGENVTKSIENE